AWRRTQPHPKPRRVPGLARAAAGRLGAPWRVVLGATEAFGRGGTEERGDGPIWPSQAPLRWLVAGPFPGWRDRQNAAFALHHDISSIAGSWGHERKAARRAACRAGADQFCPGPGLAESA